MREDRNTERIRNNEEQGKVGKRYRTEILPEILKFRDERNAANVRAAKASSRRCRNR